MKRNFLIWLLAPVFIKLSNSVFNSLMLIRRNAQLRDEDEEFSYCELPEKYGCYTVYFYSKNKETRQLWYHPVTDTWYEQNPDTDDDHIAGHGSIVKNSKGRDSFIQHWEAVPIKDLVMR